MSKKQSSALAIYNKPTAEMIRSGLQLTRKLRTRESEFIRYKACFSHFLEAKTALNEAGFKEKNLVKSFYNELNRKTYLKIIINDLTHNFSKLDFAYLSKAYKKPAYRNSVNTRRGDGVYIETVSEMNELLRSGYDFEGVEWSISEDVILLPIEREHLKINCFLVKVPARNLLISLRRLFSNVGVVLMANDLDQMYNLSVTNLLKEEHLYPEYKAARWYFIDEYLPIDFIKLLTKLGASCTILPFKGKNADYASLVIEEVTQIIASGS